MSMQDVLERVRAGEADPACLACGGILKSDTISFGRAVVRRSSIRHGGTAAGKQHMALADQYDTACATALHVTDNDVSFAAGTSMT